MLIDSLTPANLSEMQSDMRKCTKKTWSYNKKCDIYGHTTKNVICMFYMGRGEER
jgi:hypothetical protein